MNPQTHTMKLSWAYQLAHYLMRTEDAFDVVVRAVRDHKNLIRDETEQIAYMLEAYGTEKLLKHPERLVDGMCLYLGERITRNVVLGILRTHLPDFNSTDLNAYEPKKLEKYDRCNNGKLKGVILDILSELSEDDLERVKLLLSWGVLMGYGLIRRERVMSLSPCHLAEQIFSQCSDHPAIVMSLIFTQIQRADLVEELAAAAREGHSFDAIPVEVA